MALAGCAGSGPRALVIGIDGLRADALARAKVPALDALRAQGLSTVAARTQLDAPALSGPGWATVLSGVLPPKHGVRDNDGFARHDHRFPSFLARAQAAGRRAEAAVHWKPLAASWLAGEALGDVRAIADDEAVLDAACRMAGGEARLLFVHFDDVDLTGHASGFSLDNPRYLAALEATDARIERLLAVVRARPRFADERWLVVVVSDHGGDGAQHGPKDAPNQTIPLVLSGAIAARGELGAATQADVAPTVLAHLGVPIDPAWQLDGRPLAR